MIIQNEGELRMVERRKRELRKKRSEQEPQLDDGKNKKLKHP